MGLKASITFGAKRSHDYNSDQFSVTLESEITNPANCQPEIAALFGEAKAAVQQQIEAQNPPSTQPASNGGNGNGTSVPGNGNGGNGNGHASQKQLSFITRLAKLKQLSKADVLRLAGVNDLADLTTKAASEVIDRLKGRSERTATNDDGNNRTRNAGR